MCISTLGYCPIDVNSSKPLLTKVRLNREKDITDLIKQNKSSSKHLSYPKVSKELETNGYHNRYFQTSA